LSTAISIKNVNELCLRREKNAIDRAFFERFLARFSFSIFTDIFKIFLYLHDKCGNFFLEGKENRAERIDFSFERGSKGFPVPRGCNISSAGLARGTREPRKKEVETSGVPLD